ncbi:MAG: S24/S26 family peptidase [Prevotella sp.]|nr:S24/S26 family peptidase [Prevotella sp.]
MPQDPDSQIKTRQMANAVLLPEVTRMIDEGHSVTLPLRGRSMRPFLEDGRDKALLVRMDREPRVGDPVLAEISKGHYVLHRIVAIDGQRLTLRGDGNLGTEQCTTGDIRALAVGFYRKGRTKADTTDALKWRLYSWLWMRLLPVRRYLLFALHPHIPNKIRKIISK